MARGWVAVGIACACACAARHDGAYLEVTSPAAFDRLEFFFAGKFPSRQCDATAVGQPVQPIDATAKWTRGTTNDRHADAMWRRQPAANDSIAFDAAQTSFTFYVPEAVDDPTAGFPDQLGALVA